MAVDKAWQKTTNDEGKTPFTWAQEKGSRNLLDLLRPHSCAQDSPDRQAGPMSTCLGVSLKRAGSFREEPPLLFLCPITQDIMLDPVVAADGNTYERQAIEE
eukprot:scaffold329913_cov42-Prasinocladus_malaysianus.AAC.1